ncbi:hypothetical protein NFI96_020778 [Prochilodus magdalenae]|nr:hypothetical protein NFI96_020778 [Prochilodus magdalenae]
MALISFSLLLLTALLPRLCHSASVNVGIVNGTEAKPHSRPYMVSIQINKRHICGGFLVTEQFVMTAAHCKNPVTNWAQMTVVVGGHDLRNVLERVQVKEHYSHQNFTNDLNNPFNDIMLLKLEKSIENSKNAAQISIPEKNEDIEQNTDCSIAGWGLLENDLKEPSDVLREANVTMLRSSKCLAEWKNSNILCTDVHHGGFCLGDSGGPLVCSNVAVGIISVVNGKCETPSKAYAYTKISGFLPWIREIISRMK